MTRRAHLQEQSPRILELYESGLSLREIAAMVGGSAQGVSLLLRSLGVDPQARRMEAARLRRQIMEARYRVREANGGRWAHMGTPEQRMQATWRFEELADSLGITPGTLAQWYSRTGAYAYPRKPRIDAILPARDSEEGERIAELTKQACAPWNPRHLYAYNLRAKGRYRAEYLAWLGAQDA